METQKPESIHDSPTEAAPSGSDTKTVGTYAPENAVIDGERSAAWQHPVTIGHYRVLHLLGEGGMGSVYLAEQENPHRAVALKVIKPGFVSAEALRRFEQEGQALGRLQHPGIAQIYEAGTTDGGFGPQPFFAMEFIEGRTLIEFAEERRLNLRERLELIAKICDAVNHAHQRGLIHRDLKPANIIVDETGQPKILDFGVAHVTDSDTEMTRQTDVGQLIGTLNYMSPEQVLADPGELDIRSDVYALGVIAYQLLAGKMPYDTSRKALHEVVRAIREEDPAPLSSINHTYRGDVQTIVAKALEKDKTRRYASAAELAADIRRYLADQPIVAHPPSTSYQLQKFAKRHRALVAGAAAVFLVLIVGVVVSTWQAVRARRAEATAVQQRDRASTAERVATTQRDRAVEAEEAARQERDRSVAAEALAEKERNAAVVQQHRADSEAARATAVNDFLQNDLLAQASAAAQSGPNTKPDPDLKVRTALDRAAAKISGKFDKQPEVEASIRDTIGQTYLDLGLYPEARKQLELALALHKRVEGPDNPKTLETAWRLGNVVERQGKYPEAEALLSQTLEADRRVLGPEHPETLHCMNSLALVYNDESKYARAEALLIQVLEIDRRVFGPEDRETLTGMETLAIVYSHQGKSDESLALQTQLLEIRRRVLGPEHPDTLFTMTYLGNHYNADGKYPQAEALYLEVVEIERRVLGPEHPETVSSMNSLGVVYSREGKHAQAEAFYSQIAEIDTKVLGPEHPNTLIAMGNLAVSDANSGKYAEAEALLTKNLEIDRRVLAPGHPYTLTTMNNLAAIYGHEGKYAEAEVLFTQTLEIDLRVLGAIRGPTLYVLSSRAFMHQVQGKYSLAETDLTQALAGRRQLLGPEHPDTMESAADLALAEESQGKFAESETLAREAETMERTKRPNGWLRFWAESLLGASLAGEKKYAEAEPLLLDGYRGMLERKDQIVVAKQRHLDSARDWIAQLYEAWGKPQKAAEWKQD